MSFEEIFNAYPDLEAGGISQSLRYGAYLTKEIEVDLSHTACSLLLIAL